MKFTRRAGRFGAPAWLSVAAAAAIALSGCGSDSETSGGGGGGGGSTSASNESVDVSASQAAVDEATKPPESILQTEPLESAPEPGKTVAFIKCELSQCADIASGVKAGTEALGWNYKELTFKSSDPATLITSMKQALQFKPTAVSFSGIPQEVWKGVIPSYEQAGVKIVPIVTGPLAEPSETVPVTVGDFTSMGEALGHYVIAKSGGSATALMVDLPAFPILTGYVKGAAKVLDEACPDCEYSSFDGTLAQVTSGQFVNGIVTALKKVPDADFVISSDLLFHPTLPAAMKAAQIDGITVVGGQPEPSDLKAIKDGNGGAAALYNNVVTGWVAADAIARVEQGMELTQEDVKVPGQLLVQDNIESTELDDYATPEGFEEQFKELWKVG